MLIFLKNPTKRCLSRQRWAIFLKTHKIMVFEILTFDFYPEGKRQLQTTVYMNANPS